MDFIDSENDTGRGTFRRILEARRRRRRATCRLRENFALRAVGDDAAARDEDYPVDLRDDVREIVRH